MLEEMKEAIPFLAVITADPSGNRENFIEALQLARVLKDKKIATERGASKSWQAKALKVFPWSWTAS